MAKFERKQITVDHKNYDILVKKQTSLGPSCPRLVIVSYLPNETSKKLIMIAVQTIRKFTKIPYELWIVDNNSPESNLDWIVNQKEINLVLNKTTHVPEEIAHAGSYFNGVAIEIAKQLVEKDTLYFMPLHQDIAVCNPNWLNYLMSKFSNTIKAVGVREDRTRVKDGILHVLGYIVDFQLVQKYELSFLPYLPELDTGDKVIIDIKNMGFNVFATPNTIWDPTLVNQLGHNSPFRELNVDRSFDDEGNVIFLHFGRGVLKSTGEAKSKGIDIDTWFSFITKNFL